MIDDVTTLRRTFEAAAIDAVGRIGPAPLRQFAELVENGMLVSWIRTNEAASGYKKAAESIMNSLQDLDDFSGQAAAAYLRGVAAGYECRPHSIAVEPVQTDRQH